MHEKESLLQILMACAALLLIVMLSVFAISAVRFQNKRLALNEDVMRAEMRILEQERLRISLDLHDDLANELATLKMYLYATNQPKELLAEAMDVIIDRAADKLRNIAYNLQPVVLYKIGWKAAIAELASNVQKTAAFQVILQLDTEILDKELMIHTYRIIQEAFTNACNHSECSTISVCAFSEKDMTILKIQDDGKGFNKKKVLSSSKGNGVKNIYIRTRLIGGTVKLYTKLSGGTQFIIKLPSHDGFSNKNSDCRRPSCF